VKSGVSAQASQHGTALHGETIVITRPAGTGGALARKIRALGGVPLLLPGLSLRAAADAEAARAQWLKAQNDDVLIFTSPAAVRYAMGLAPLATRATVIATGQGTAAALHRIGIEAQVPRVRQDSEGLLELPPLQQLQGRHVALITAPGGRGLLQQQLVTRGASLREVHVYRRGSPRLDRRHIDAAQHLPHTACVLLSSGEAMQNLLALLPSAASRRLREARLVVSSDRIAEQARASGFSRVYVAASATQVDLLARACKVYSHERQEAGRAGC
jgi:uroporphyrinogen-III synthase